MARWRRLSSVAGLATGIAAASAGAVIAAEKVAVGRIRLRPDPAQGRAVRAAAGAAGRGRRRRRRAAARRDLRADRTRRSRSSSATATRSARRSGTTSARTWRPTPGWCSGTSAATAGPGRSDPAHVSIDQLGADLAAVLAATVPGRRPGRARRALDGRHDDHGARRAAAGAVRPEGHRRRADLDHRATWSTPPAGCPARCGRSPAGPALRCCAARPAAAGRR